jgi:23S rRNA (uracil1939-C5)-methyltransferase
MFVRDATTGELMVNIVFGYEDKEHRVELLDQLLQQFPQITTLLYTINTKKNDSLTTLIRKPILAKGILKSSWKISGS